MKGLRKYFLIFALLISTSLLAKEYSIFSVSQGFPMTSQHLNLKKNYYVNLGANQGVAKGNLIDVTRTVVQVDPYDGDARYEFKIKIGELKVIHIEADASIAVYHSIEEGEEVPYIETPNFMVGDEVRIHVD